MMAHLKFIIAVSVFLLISPHYLQASKDVDKLTNISLEQAIEKALANNLELSAAVFEGSKAQARTFQASRLPNPELSIEVEDFGGSGELRESDAIETTVMISQPFSMAILPMASKARAEKREPVGLDGLLIMMALVFAVAYRARTSGFRSKSSFSSRGTITGTPPASWTMGG